MNPDYSLCDTELLVFQTKNPSSPRRANVRAMPGPEILPDVERMLSDRFFLVYLAKRSTCQKRFGFAAHPHPHQRDNISNVRLFYHVTGECQIQIIRLPYVYPTTLSPPSTGMMAPVSQVMSGSASATSTAATSSVVVRRSAGLRWRASTR